MADAANVLCLGPPGVGKTHLAVALGIKAIEAGYGVYFVRAHDLLEDLRRAQAEHRLDRRMRVYLAPVVIATALLDRLLHHSHVLNIRGESYRLRGKKRAGLFGGTQPHKEVMGAAQTQP